MVCNDIHTLLNLACLKATGFYLPQDEAVNNKWKYKVVDGKKVGIITGSIERNWFNSSTYNDIPLQISRRLIVQDLNYLFNIRDEKRKCEKKIKGLINYNSLENINSYGNHNNYSNYFNRCRLDERLNDTIAYLSCLPKRSPYKIKLLKQVKKYKTLINPLEYYDGHLTAKDFLLIYDKFATDGRCCKGKFDKGEKFDLSCIDARGVCLYVSSSDTHPTYEINYSGYIDKELTTFERECSNSYNSNSFKSRATIYNTLENEIEGGNWVERFVKRGNRFRVRKPSLSPIFEVMERFMDTIQTDKYKNSYGNRPFNRYTNFHYNQDYIKLFFNNFMGRIYNGSLWDNEGDTIMEEYNEYRKNLDDKFDLKDIANIFGNKSNNRTDKVIDKLITHFQ